MRFKLSLVLLLLLLSTSGLSAQNYICMAATYDGEKIFVINFDSTSSYLDFPFMEVDSLPGEVAEAGETGLFYEEFASGKEIQFNVRNRGTFYTGGITIDGHSFPVKCYLGAELQEEDKLLYPADYINMRDDTDTLAISIDKDKNLYFCRGDEKLKIYSLASGTLLLDDGSEITLRYSKERPYTIIFYEDGRKQFYYRADKKK